MSLRRSSGRPRTCSGDMYPNLPLSTPAIVRELRDVAFAMPKSMTLTSPSYETRTFCGEQSR